MINLDNSIIPNESMAGIKLRTNINDLGDITASAKRHVVKEYFGDIVQEIYTIADGTIDIVVDLRNSKVYRITAYSGFKGMLFGKINIGMNAGDALDMLPNLYYDEPYELLLFKDIKGISLDINEIDPPVEIVRSCFIEAISVYAVEAVSTLAGFEGKW